MSKQAPAFTVKMEHVRCTLGPHPHDLHQCLDSGVYLNAISPNDRDRARDGALTVIYVMDNHLRLPARLRWLATVASSR